MNGSKTNTLKTWSLIFLALSLVLVTSVSRAGVIEYDVTFQSEGQSYWGPSGAPPEFRANIFQFDIDSGRAMAGASTYGEFGTFTRTQTPEFCVPNPADIFGSPLCTGGGVYWVGADLDMSYAQSTSMDFIATLGEGQVDVRMPYNVTFDVPDLTNLKAGDIVSIQTTKTELSDANISTSFADASVALNISGDIDLEAIFEICTGSCTWIDMVTGDDVSDTRRRNHHYDFDVDLLSYDSKLATTLTSDSAAGFVHFLGEESRGALLPGLSEDEFATRLSDFAIDVVANFARSAIHGYGFDSLTISTPDIDTTGGFSDGKLSSSGEHTFLGLDWDLDTLAMASATCVFPLSLICSRILGDDYEFGGVSASYNLIDFNSLIGLTSQQAFEFQPLLTAFLEIGPGGRQIAFTPGDTIEFVVEEDTDSLEITPFFELENTFRQDTRFSRTADLATTVLEAELEFDLPGSTVNLDPLNIIPGSQNVGIGGASFDDDWGPHEQQTTRLADSEIQMFSNEFELGGFSTVQGASFRIGQQQTQTPSTAVPEPGTAWLLGMMATMLAGGRLRTRSTAREPGRPV